MMTYGVWVVILRCGYENQVMNNLSMSIKEKASHYIGKKRHRTLYFICTAEYWGKVDLFICQGVEDKPAFCSN